MFAADAQHLPDVARPPGQDAARLAICGSVSKDANASAIGVM